MRMHRMSSLTTTATLLLSGLFVLTACSSPADDNTQQNQGEDETLTCTASSWSCEEFVAGGMPNLDRFRHDAVALDDERVLLLGGSERLEGGAARSTDTWEVYNVEQDEVAVEARDFEVPRRNPSVVRLDDDSVLLVGGEDADGDRLQSVLHFSADTMEWTDLDADMNAGYSKAIPLEDGRILALGITHSYEPVRVVGQVFDPDALEWSSVGSGDLLHDSVDDYDFQQLPDGRILFTYTHRAPESDQPEPGEDAPDDFDPTLYERTAVAYDFESGEVETLREFDEQVFGYDSRVVELSGDRFLWHVNTEDLNDQGMEIPDETVGSLYDAEAGEFSEQYRRELENETTMDLMKVLPGDEIVYDYGTPFQIHDVESGDWYDFTALPADTPYSTMTMMPDCRLFVSGERGVGAGDEDRTPTGLCVSE